MDITKCHDGGLDVSEVCAAAGGVCQYHGAAYGEQVGITPHGSENVDHYEVFNNGVLLQKAITTTKKCCVNVTTAIVIGSTIAITDFEIERPTGSIRTTQEDELTSAEIRLMHHGAWEVLDAGSYTYYLMNRSGATRYPYATWMKIIASDCDG